MSTDFNLCFLRQKLASIKNATMFNAGNQPLKLPNDIVTLLRVDDEGQLWFTGHQPRGWINNYEQSFPARLFFYQKGIEYYLEAKGCAYLANHEERLVFQDEMAPNTILLRMTPSVIEYTEPKVRKPLPSFSKYYASVRNWFTKWVPVYHFSKAR